MLEAIKFFTSNLSWILLGIFNLAICLNIVSYTNCLNTEKHIFMNLSKILTYEQTQLNDTLFELLLNGTLWLTLYTISQLVIEIIGKYAITISVRKSIKTL